MVKLSIGDLIKVVSPQTTGYTEGEVGIVTRVERVNDRYYVYWVLFGKETDEVPMWDIEIQKIA
jgi:predicted AlkP superfamily phosphohydrolase/phosphomutase